MIKPLLEKAEDGRWYCRWQLTPSGKVWGTSHSSDLLKWAPQQYVNAGEACRAPTGHCPADCP